MSIDCNSCSFKRNVPGDCHISCVHPVVNENGNDMKVLLGIMSSGGQLFAQQLGFTFSPHAVSSGWANYPLNYDPIWMSGSCKLREHYEKVIAEQLIAKSNG